MPTEPNLLIETGVLTVAVLIVVFLIAKSFRRLRDSGDGREVGDAVVWSEKDLLTIERYSIVEDSEKPFDSKIIHRASADRDVFFVPHLKETMARRWYLYMFFILWTVGMIAVVLITLAGEAFQPGAIASFQPLSHAGAIVLFFIAWLIMAIRIWLILLRAIRIDMAFTHANRAVVADNSSITFLVWHGTRIEATKYPGQRVDNLSPGTMLHPMMRVLGGMRFPFLIPLPIESFTFDYGTTTVKMPGVARAEARWMAAEIEKRLDVTKGVVR